MNQKTFLLRLRAGLQRLPAKEINEIVSDYEEFFRDGIAEGHTEEEIATRLGDPERIAKELNARSRLQDWEKRKSFGSLWGVVMAYAGLGALNFVLAFPLLFWLLVLTCWGLTSGGLLLAGVICTGLGVTQWAFGWPETDNVVVTHKHQIHSASGTASISIGSNSVDIVGTDAQQVKNAIAKTQKGDGDGSVEITANKETGETEINIKGADGNVHISTRKPVKAAEDDDSVSSDIEAARQEIAAAKAEGQQAAEEGKRLAAEASGQSGRTVTVVSSKVTDSADDDGTEVVKKVLSVGHRSGSDKLLPVGLFLLFFGGLGMLITVFLARWTARTVSRFIRYQLDLLGMNKAEQSAA